MEAKVTTRKLSKLTAKIERLNRAAKRKGSNAEGLLTLKIGKPFIESVPMNEKLRKNLGWPQDMTSRSHAALVEFVILTIEGYQPVVKGWQLVAKIEHLGGKNLFWTNPYNTVLIPQEYRNTRNYCDECHKHRQRKETFLLFNGEIEEYRQVGRNCLATYMPATTADQLIRWYEMVQNFFAAVNEPLDTDGVSGYQNTDTDVYLAVWMAKQVLENYGWISRKKSEDLMATNPPSAVLLTYNLLNRKWLKTERPEWLYPMPDSPESIVDPVNEILAAIRSLETVNDYIYNVQTALSQRTVKQHHLALIISGVNMVAGVSRKEYNFVNEKIAPVGYHFGKKKNKKIVTPVVKMTVLSNRREEGKWGVSHKVWGVDAGGRKVFIYGSGESLWDLEKDQTVFVGGKVKKHFQGQNDGMWVTMLSHVKVLDIEENEVEVA